MATIKKSKKMKIIIPVCIVLVIALVAGSVFAVSSNKKVVQVSLSEIGTGDIVENISATGTVQAGMSKTYSAGTIAQCKELYVKVGDKVQKGDKLATFDTQELDTQIASLQASYSDSSTAYYSAVKSQKENKQKLDEVNKKITPLEKKMKKLQKEASSRAKTTTTTKKRTTTTTTTTTKASTTRKRIITTTTTTAPSSSQSDVSADASERPKNDPINIPSNIPSISIPSISIPSVSSVSVPTTSSNDIASDLEEAVKALKELAETISKLSDDITTTNAITRSVMTAIAEELEKGNYSPEAISKAAGDAMSDAIKKGLIDETKLLIDSGAAVQMIETAVKAVNWEAIGKSIANSDNATLASTELQLAALYAQREIFSVGANATVLNAQKQAMNATKQALDTLKKTQQELQTGWISSIDGIVTECSVEEGAQTSALQTGIKVENLDKLVVKLSLGEYDVHKVSVGMKADISTAYGKYTGEIVSIAPTATGASESSVLDNVGSMAGVSGLSSLTSKGAGVECIVSVDLPDTNIIAGFDANVEIRTGSFTGVPTVPIESIVLEKEGAYVYKYNEEDGTVSKTKIEVGSHSDFAYEIKSGLSVGDKIVTTPGQDYEEDTFKVKVK